MNLYQPKTCRQRVNQKLIVLDLGNVSIKKVLAMKFITVKVSQKIAISTSNPKLERTIWDKLSESNFETIEIARVKRGWFIPKFARNKHVITGESHQANKLFVLKLISFKSGQLQNNTVNGAMSISINCVIIWKKSTRA